MYDDRAWKECYYSTAGWGYVFGFKRRSLSWPLICDHTAWIHLYLQSNTKTIIRFDDCRDYIEVKNYVWEMAVALLAGCLN